MKRYRRQVQAAGHPAKLLTGGSGAFGTVSCTGHLNAVRLSSALPQRDSEELLRDKLFRLRTRWPGLGSASQFQGL